MGAVAVHPDDPARYARIVGKLVEIRSGPEYRRLIPIITDDTPDPGFRLGAVKITGAHDFNDYGVMRAGIPLYALMDTKGAMRQDGLSMRTAPPSPPRRAGRGRGRCLERQPGAEDLRGLDRYAARKLVIDQINAEGWPSPICTRKSTARPAPSILNARAGRRCRSCSLWRPLGRGDRTDADRPVVRRHRRIVGPALEAVRDGRTQILPEQHKKVYFNWLENIEPWTISRQLWGATRSGLVRSRPVA